MEGEAGPCFSETEYPAGFIWHCDVKKLFHFAVIELLKKDGSRFDEGLNVFDNLGDFLINGNSLHFLFKRNSVTADGMIALLRRHANSDPNSEIIEKINYIFICKFFKEIFSR
jgi:hypothetical protein